MSDKKYFWLKLPRDFFDKHYIKILRNKEDGNRLIFFYIRLLTESIDHEGTLRYSATIPYTNETLAQVSGFDIDFVNTAMDILKEMELVTIMDDKTIFLPKSIKMIGSESDSASRVRKFRDKQKKTGSETPKAKTKKPKTKAKKSDPKPKAETNVYKEIIDYFNEKAGTKYRYTTKSTQTSINGRLNDGFSVDDFKVVIDVKVKKWLNDLKMRDYLRPETLFAASHFESYLNEVIAETPEKYPGLDERMKKRSEETLKNFVDDGRFN